MVAASMKKVMTSVFWDTEGVLFNQKGNTINGEHNVNLLTKLRESIKQNVRAKLTKGT